MPQSIGRIARVPQLLLNLGEPTGLRQFNHAVICINHVERAGVVIGDAERLDTAKKQTLGRLLIVMHRNLNLATVKLSQQVMRAT